MTSNYDPWATIPAALKGRFARRRVESESNHTLFWFRDEMNRPGLLIEISRSLSIASLQTAKLNIRDIAVDVIDVPDDGIRALVVKLQEEQNRDVFLKLCLDLIDRVTGNVDGADTFAIVCGRLKQWQSLLSGKAKRPLSINEIQGLYAELYFIAEMLEQKACPATTLIRGWEGPEEAQHDFVLDDTAVEIKSVGGHQREKVRISSEDQLHTHLDRMYLRVYFLSVVQTGNNAESLNAIVRRVTAQLDESGDRELFAEKLNQARYIDIPDYDEPLFRVKDCLTYLVSETFPRITRDALPEGIEAVSYDLVLANVEQYRIATIDITGA